MPCIYGTELTLPGKAVVMITPAMLADALLPEGLDWMLQVLAPLIGEEIDAADLCGSAPPPKPEIGIEILWWPHDDLYALLLWIMWPIFCRCKPGTPAPVPYEFEPLEKPVGLAEGPLI